MPSRPARRALARLAAAALFAFSFPLAVLAAADMKPLHRVEPEFPREALQAGAEEGKVHARMTIDGAGEVTRVEIVAATPRRVFDRAVLRALSQWKYPAGATGRTVDINLKFESR